MLVGCEKVSPALIEKLNTLLEENFLIINECFDEQGNEKKIIKHADFRIIFLYNSSK